VDNALRVDRPVENDTDRQREELKQAIRVAMEKGELVQEPELTLSNGHRSVDAMNWDGGSNTQRTGNKNKQKSIKKAKSTPQDAFFEVSDSGPDEDEEG
jgi:hypothetical protein